MTVRVSRREFMAGSTIGLTLGVLPAGSQREETLPWYQSMRRCGQLNMNAKDAIDLDVEKWMNFWESMKLDALLLNAGGIVAYYPTRIPYHHRSEFLGDRDLFGELSSEAKKRGIRVVARLDPNWNYQDTVKNHPEWFQRTPDGDLLHDPESTWLFRTCLFSQYFTSYMPEVIKEVNQAYDVDGFFTNGWPTTGAPRICFCQNCQTRFRGETGLDLPTRLNPAEHGYRRYFDYHMERVLEIWKLWHSTATEKKWDSVYFGNLHCNLRAVKNLKKLAGVAAWFNLDGQGRGGDVHPLWYCSQQGRVAQSVMSGRTITNVVGSYATTNYTIWRHSSKSAEEAALWMAQTTAAGMVPWYHRLGAAPEEDKRWRQVGLDFYQWMARHDEHFRNTKSLSDTAILYSQRTLSFWGLNDNNPLQDRSARLDYFEGIYYALLQGRHLFDFVHEENLNEDILQNYRTLILPNVAFLSDDQCKQLRAYVKSGGRLLATYETSLYNEWGDRRSDFGLGDLLGVELVGATQGPLRNSYARMASSEHEISTLFGDTRVLPGALYRVPVRLAGRGQSVMTYIPPYPSHPPEMVYPRAPESGEPALVLTDCPDVRAAYFPGDVDRSCWRTSNTDLDLLLQKTIQWVKGEGLSPVEVKGEGILEMFAWETEPGLALHLINYTNPHMLRGWVRQFYPVGRQEVAIRLPDEMRIADVSLLRAGHSIPFARENGAIRFEIPQIVDYEVVALSRSLG